MHMGEAEGGGLEAAGRAGTGGQGQPAGLTQGHVKQLTAGCVLTTQMWDWDGSHLQHWLQPEQPLSVEAFSYSALETSEVASVRLRELLHSMGLGRHHPYWKLWVQLPWQKDRLGGVGGVSQAGAELPPMKRAERGGQAVSLLMVGGMGPELGLHDGLTVCWVPYIP